MSLSTSASTSRPTVAQALVRFLSAQYTAREGERHRLIAGTWAIFGHGTIAGIGRALIAYGDGTPHAVRVLADPAETGAGTVALPQDVQAAAYDRPEGFSAERVWPLRRPAPDPAEVWW